MTCIVGLVSKNATYIGGDSAATSGWYLTVRSDSKVFRNGPFLFGFTTSFRMGQLIQHALVPPPVPATSPEKFMATTFVDSIRQCLKDGGFAKKENDQEEGGAFLVAVKDRLFTIHEDYQVAEAQSGYSAVGCGRELAVGALFASGTTNAQPRSRVLQALAAAEAHSAGVRGPFTVMNLQHPKDQ